MKETTNQEKLKLPKVRIDKSLNKYDNVVLFPKQVERAREMFEKAGGLNKIAELIKQHQPK